IRRKNFRPAERAHTDVRPGLSVEAGLRRQKGLSGDPLEAEQRRAPAKSRCGIGVSFFWLLFLDKQDKIAGSDFARKPRRGEAQGRAEQK
ncbi:hypothetical protein, partial [Thioalkalivibrio sulfidiphilus]|uniref:hypothetical protein n=1 Tax=Thioalkalivibrio sulfidiphilus TaxID=1033854 RepID=UPI000571EA7B